MKKKINKEMMMQQKCTLALLDEGKRKQKIMMKERKKYIMYN
jgi:hypothetical protein